MKSASWLAKSPMSGPILEMSSGMAPCIRPEAALIQIEELLGEGLSSRVFAALRVDSRGFSRQDIVLKILKTETDVSWMKREFEVLSQVRSPHCVRILGWENLPEGPALVLERIRGMTLLELASDGDLSGAEQSEIIAQIQEGLRAVHAANLHHGDLSPGNIMIDSEGCVRLIDFALIASNSGQIAGTPPYISIETWQGAPLSAAADLFSLGLIQQDMKNSFSEVPKGPEACRNRARAALGKSELLMEEPAHRAFLVLKSSPESRKSLAQRVRSRLIEKERGRFVTQALPESGCESTRRSRSGASRDAVNRFPRLRSPRRACAAAICALVLAAPPFSAETVDASTVAGPQRAGGTLDVRTLKWTELELDGRPLGFAPVTVGNLAPGEYTLHWRDIRRRGEIQLQILSGERIVVTDRELTASPGKD